MGLFDNIEIKEYSLPQPPHEEIQNYKPETSFQTKDLGEEMGEYKIDGDGYLWKLKTEIKWEDPPANPKSIFDLYRQPTEISREWLRSNITSTLNIYTHQNDEIGDYDYWIEYDIVFIQGMLSEAKLIKFTATNNFAKKERNKTWETELQSQYLFEQTVWYKWFWKWYFKIIRKSFRLAAKCLSKLEALFWNIERRIT